MTSMTSAPLPGCLHVSAARVWHMAMPSCSVPSAPSSPHALLTSSGLSSLPPAPPLSTHHDPEKREQSPSDLGMKSRRPALELLVEIIVHGYRDVRSPTARPRHGGPERAQVDREQPLHGSGARWSSQRSRQARESDKSEEQRAARPGPRRPIVRICSYPNACYMLHAPMQHAMQRPVSHHCQLLPTLASSPSLCAWYRAPLAG